jgi:hypothetical protein
VSPRSGGEAAKFGDRFEGRWTVRYLLDVLFGRVETVVVEDIDEAAESVEFYATVNGVEQGHQVKRQWRTNVTWPVSLLKSEGILRDALTHVQSGREFHFVSTLKSGDLDALSDVARRSDDYERFDAHLDAIRKSRRDASDVLAGEWGGPMAAYQVLRSVFVWSPDERQLERENLTVAGWLIEGSPDAAVALLAQIVLDTLSTTLSSPVLWQELEGRGVARNPLFDDTTLPTLVSAQTDRWLRSATRELLQPPILRAESDQIVETMKMTRNPVMVAGDAGIGKSAVVASVVEALRNEGWPVLALRLDRAGDSNSARQLGERLDLPASPVLALGSVAGGAPALLACDQLDATSRASGRVTEVFDAFDELLREAERFPEMRVLLACRQFDIDNDQRLRSLVDPSRKEPATVVTIPALDAEAVAGAVRAMGLDPDRLTPWQTELLRSPFNLVLLRELATESEALDFATLADLFDRYWRMKRRAAMELRLPRETRFDAVIERLVSEMSNSQRLAVPESALFAGGLDDDASALVAEHIIVHEGGRYAFAHEALFDYAFVRTWLALNQSGLDFLLAGEQELFRRAQVRQILSYWKEHDRDRFAADVRELLMHLDVRFHIKEVVLALMRALDDPTSEELQILLQVLGSDFIWRDRVELLLRADPWFERLDADGVLESWLASGEEIPQNRAVPIMAIGGKANGDRVAELLRPYEDEEAFPGWLIFCARFIDLDRSRALFEFVLQAVRAGKLEGRTHEVWLSAHALGQKAPTWAVELLSAWLVDRPAALTVENERVLDMAERDYGLLELIRESAEGASRDFVAALLTYMQRVMAATTVGRQRPYGDWHFGVPIWNGIISEVDDALFAAMRSALRAVASEDPEGVRALIEPLADDEHHAAQSLLYEALASAGPVHADWAAELLMRGEFAVEAGYSDGHYWVTRELLKATSPHMSDESFEQVEAFLRGYVPEWEQREQRFGGHAAFTLLSAVDPERLSHEGTAMLETLRRKFGSEEPVAPRGIIGGMVGSPITAEEAREFTDEDWRTAMKAYPDESRDLAEDFLRGGAFELASQVLQALAKEDPDRFAALGLSLDESFNPTYLQSILIGVAESDSDFDAEKLYALLRHAAALSTNDRWLGYPLKRLYEARIPDDIIAILIDRAARAPSDNEEADDPGFAGINNSRGANIHTLAILVSTDPSGHRAGLVESHLAPILATQSTPCRAMAAELLRALFPWRPEATLEGFRLLAATADVGLFQTPQFEGLAAAVILRDAEVAMPLIQSMLEHDNPDVREKGARLATFAATDGGQADLLAGLAQSADVATRVGVAAVLADRARWVTESLVHEQLERLFNDEDPSVREAAAQVAMRLRGADLTQYSRLLLALIASPALSNEVAQLAITLDHAPGEIVELSLALARLFLELFDREIGDIQTHASGDARQIGELVLRAYSQARSAGARTEILDLVDRLLELNTYGFEEKVDEVGRHG